MADEIVEPAGCCRYCGILPGQDLPRPSYPELRARYAEALRLLSVPISEMDTAYGAECDAFLSRALSGSPQEASDG